MFFANRLGPSAITMLDFEYMLNLSISYEGSVNFTGVFVFCMQAKTPYGGTFPIAKKNTKRKFF